LISKKRAAGEDKIVLASADMDRPQSTKQIVDWKRFGTGFSLPVISAPLLLYP